jgi:hypothetical protein
MSVLLASEAPLGVLNAVARDKLAQVLAHVLGRLSASVRRLQPAEASCALSNA